MRVIAGEARGRKLRAGKGQAIRPTAAKVKGALFNILASRFDLDGADVLDLFAGAGTLGIEALSRGARGVTFVEAAAAAARILRDNIERCGLADRSRVLQSTAAAALRRLAGAGARFDGALLDPPYEARLVEPTLASLGGLNLVRPGGWVVVEHAVDEPVAERYGDLRLTQDRRYGKTALAVFTAHAESEKIAGS